MADHRRAPDIPEHLVEWVWAYRHALELLDQFDAEGLYNARECQSDWPLASWHGFLSTYGLKQGKHAELRDKQADVFTEVVPIFRSPVSERGSSEELSRRWQEGVNRIGRLCNRKTKNGKPPALQSMVSKLLWFYQPELMMMCDEYSRTGLSRRGLGANVSVSLRDYLELCEALFKEERDKIEEAAAFSDRSYPYPRRVLDQWLWLQGLKHKQNPEYLRPFRLSLNLAPIMPRYFKWDSRQQADRRTSPATLKDVILAIGKRCAAIPDCDLRSAEEIVGYDDDGLPN